MDEYNDIRDLLRPHHDIKASDELRRKVEAAFDPDRRRRSFSHWILGGISISAVAASLILMFIPKGMSAKAIISEVISRLENTQNIEMILEVRTRSIENFKFIDKDENFIRHDIFISRSDSVLSWEIDKGDRAAVGLNRDIKTWIKPLRIGWHSNDHDITDILGYMANLLNPKEILEVELEQCLASGGSRYSVEKKDNEIYLTVKAKARGDFRNPYLLNTSIAESDNIRRYVIDAVTKELKSASVSIITDGREIPVLRIISINYNPRLDNAFQIPAGIHFVENETILPGLAGLSAEEAASTVLNAFSDWNTDILDLAISPSLSQAAYRQRFYGATLLSVGQAFTSGNGNSTFVPYKIKLSDGTIQCHNISLQRSDSNGWIVVGGL